MHGRPCTPEGGAANDLASAHVAGHGHRFRLEVDQPAYLRLLRFFASLLGRAAFHPSVTRRAESYESHPSWVSIQSSLGSFTANAVEDGAEVTIGDVQTRVLNWGFGVSMLGR